MIRSVDAQLVTRNALNGIIYKLKNVYKVDPITSNIVVPSSVNDIKGTCKTLVYWNESLFDAGDDKLYKYPWFQLSFPSGLIFPTAYSMRGVSGGFYFPSTWEVFGIPEDKENDESSWDLLATNSRDESTYCKIIVGSGCNDAVNVGTFTLKETSKGYKHLRWRLKTVYGNGNPYFPSSGVDVYGVLVANSLHLRVKRSRCVNKVFYPREIIFNQIKGK